MWVLRWCCICVCLLALTMLICWYVDMLICWYVDMLICWYVVMLMCWYVVMLLCWYVDMLICWYVVMLICWYVVMLLCWCVDVLICCYVDMLICMPPSSPPMYAWAVPRCVSSCSPLELRSHQQSAFIMNVIAWDCMRLLYIHHACHVMQPTMTMTKSPLNLARHVYYHNKWWMMNDASRPPAGISHRKYHQ